MNGMKTGTIGLPGYFGGQKRMYVLSDLAKTGTNMIMPHHLHEINAQEFSLREWEDTVSYLTDRVNPSRHQNKRSNI